MSGAGPGEIALQGAAGGSNAGFPSRRSQRSRQLDSAALGAARDKAREDLQYCGRAFFCLGTGHVSVVGHSAVRGTSVG